MTHGIQKLAEHKKSTLFSFADLKQLATVWIFIYQRSSVENLFF